MMLFVVDIGNSQIVTAVFPLLGDGEIGLRESPLALWHLASDARRSGDEYCLLFKQFFEHAGLFRQSIKACVVASVVPALDAVFEGLCRELFERRPLRVHSGLRSGLKVKVQNAESLGADRLANAAAAYALLGGPAIAADFGTATKFEAVDKNGNYLGGAIAPGIGISLEALAQRTAKLPRIDFALAKSAVGRNTQEALAAGIYFSCLGQAREMLAQMRKTLGRNARAVVTGGFSSQVPWKEMGFEEQIPNLTLLGLRIIHTLNSR